MSILTMTANKQRVYMMLLFVAILLFQMSMSQDEKTCDRRELKMKRGKYKLEGRFLKRKVPHGLTGELHCRKGLTPGYNQSSLPTKYPHPRIKCDDGTWLPPGLYNCFKDCQTSGLSRSTGEFDINWEADAVKVRHGTYTHLRCPSGSFVATASRTTVEGLENPPIFCIDSKWFPEFYCWSEALRGSHTVTIPPAIIKQWEKIQEILLEGTTPAGTTPGEETEPTEIPVTGKPVTDKDGVAVTDKEGSPVTEKPEVPVTGKPVTDKDGVAVTDKEGSPVTEKPEVPVTGKPVTDKDGAAVTDKAGIPVTEKPEIPVTGKPVTDKDGIAVTDKSGIPVTEKPEIPVTGKPVTDKDGIAVTDKSGIPITEKPEIPVTGKPVTDKDGIAVTDKAGIPVTQKPEIPVTGNPVTDKDGIAVTDKSGVPITEKPEIPVTGKPVTNKDGAAVTDKDGMALTEPPIIDEGCINNNVFCSFWASIDECALNAPFMLVNCKGACDPKCPKTTTVAPTTKAIEHCVNVSPLCPFWANEGECALNPPFMLVNCNAACNPLCFDPPKTCQNLRTECDLWQQQNQCIANPIYMIKECEQSCHPECKKAL